MAAPRFFVEQDLASGTTLALPAGVAHHAQRTLRLRDGAPIALFNGRGGEYAARLLAAREARAEVLGFDPVERESPLRLTLLQSLVTSDKLDWIIEKGTELGVSAFVLMRAARSVARIDAARLANKLEHWRQVAIAACCQSGRNRVPTTRFAGSLGEALAAVEPSMLRVILAPQATQSLGLATGVLSAAIAVGPEGGFTPQELALAARAGFGAASLGTRVLRTETAGMAALASLQWQAGDLRAPVHTPTA